MELIIQREKKKVCLLLSKGTAVNPSNRRGPVTGEYFGGDRILAYISIFTMIYF